jgi:hypothetical protein
MPNLKRHRPHPFFRLGMSHQKPAFRLPPLEKECPAQRQVEPELRPLLQIHSFEIFRELRRLFLAAQLEANLDLAFGMRALRGADRSLRPVQVRHWDGLYHGRAIKPQNHNILAGFCRSVLLDLKVSRGVTSRLKIEEVVTNLLTNAMKYGARKLIY